MSRFEVIPPLTSAEHKVSEFLLLFCCDWRVWLGETLVLKGVLDRVLNLLSLDLIKIKESESLVDHITNNLKFFKLGLVLIF